MENTLNYEIKNKVLWIELSNLKHGNSYGLSESNQFAKILRENKSKFKALVFSSAGDQFFCTGGNLKLYANMKGRQPGILANRKIRAQLKQLAQLPLPTLAIVNGDCYGGGVELLSCFDFIYATPSSQFGLWQRRLGLTFGWGGGAHLLKRIPESRLKQLCLEAKTLDALEAQFLHIVDKIFHKNELLDRAHEWTQDILKLPMEPIAGIKKLNSKNEVKIFEKLWMNKSHKATLKRFTNKINEEAPSN